MTPYMWYRWHPHFNYINPRELALYQTKSNLKTMTILMVIINQLRDEQRKSL